MLSGLDNHSSQPRSCGCLPWVGTRGCLAVHGLKRIQMSGVAPVAGLLVRSRVFLPVPYERQHTCSTSFMLVVTTCYASLGQPDEQLSMH